MAKFVSFTMFAGEDDLEQPVTKPVTVNVEHLRSFSLRKHNAPGTLLIFSNGAMFSVNEPYDEVKRQVTLPPSKQRAAPGPAMAEAEVEAQPN
jgi:hypothetical protein